jgi:hypothetical protein
VTRLAPLLLAAFLAGCTIAPPPSVAEAPGPLPAKLPGIVVCMNAGLADKAKATKALPGNVVVVVYGDTVCGQRYVWPDELGGRLEIEEFGKVLRAKWPDRAVVLVVYDMPLLAAGDGHGGIQVQLRLVHDQLRAGLLRRGVAG